MQGGESFEEVARRETAGRLLAESLAQGILRLPPPVTDEPPDAVAAATADALAPQVLSRLAETYDITSWDFPAFRRAYVDGALAGWKPGTISVERGARLRVVSPGCPLLQDAAQDFRACRMCQLLHDRCARLALGGDVRSVALPRLATLGAPACVIDFRLDPQLMLRRRVQALV